MHPYKGSTYYDAWHRLDSSLVFVRKLRIASGHISTTQFSMIANRLDLFGDR